MSTPTLRKWTELVFISGIGLLSEFALAAPASGVTPAGVVAPAETQTGGAIFGNGSSSNSSSDSTNRSSSNSLPANSALNRFNTGESINPFTNAFNTQPEPSDAIEDSFRHSSAASTRANVPARSPAPILPATPPRDATGTHPAGMGGSL